MNSLDFVMILFSKRSILTSLLEFTQPSANEFTLETQNARYENNVRTLDMKRMAERSI